MNNKPYSTCKSTAQGTEGLHNHKRATSNIKI